MVNAGLLPSAEEELKREDTIEQLKKVGWFFIYVMAKNLPNKIQEIILFIYPSFWMTACNLI